MRSAAVVGDIAETRVETIGELVGESQACQASAARRHSTHEVVHRLPFRSCGPRVRKDRARPVMVAEYARTRDMRVPGLNLVVALAGSAGVSARQTQDLVGGVGLVALDLLMQAGETLDDLADTLAAEIHVRGDLLERRGLLPVEAEAEPEDLGFAAVDRVEQAAEDLEVPRPEGRAVGVETR